MDNLQQLGLVGKGISYSFSQKYFSQKFKKLMLDNFSYSIFDLEEVGEMEKLFKNPSLLGLNVTIPYKEKIIPFLDDLSPEAKEIGAVNTILIKEGVKIGFNTDAIGFENSLKIFQNKMQESAIVLGDGGAAKAIAYVLKNNEIPFITVSRKSGKSFQDLSADEVRQHKLIVQCTPVGTFPHVEDCLDFPFDGLTTDHLVMDLIYNPNLTKFLKKSQQHGAQTMNGLYMLEQQAEAAWKIWTSK